MKNSRSRLVCASMESRYSYCKACCGEYSGQLGYETLENAIVLPFREAPEGFAVGIANEHGEPVANSSLHELMGAVEYPLQSADEIVSDHRNVIYMGFLISQWGHALTDNLKRLWFLSSPGCKELIAAGYKVVYVCDPMFTPSCRAAQLISLAGFDVNDWECIRRPTRFRTVCNPDLALIEHKYGRRWTKQLSAVYDTILDHVPDSHTPCGKIYFSRTHLTGQPKWRETGEKQLERLFRKKGFRIVYPEQLAVEQQIDLLRNCESFAATECSTSHSAVWCRPGTQVIILQKARYYNSWQMAINDMRGLDATYIEAHRSDKTGENMCGGPYFLCVNHYVARFFGCSIPRLPRWLQPSWWRYRFAKPAADEGKGFHAPALPALRTTSQS